MYPADFATSHKYHAFLCYNTVDQRDVLVIKTALDRAGLRTYFAPEALGSSLDVHQELRSKVDNSRCLVLFIGAKGATPYQLAEADYASEHRHPIVKVVLRGGHARDVARSFNTRTLDCNDLNTECELIDRLIEDITSMSLARLPLQFQASQKTELTYPAELDQTGFMPRKFHVHALHTVDSVRRLFLNWVTLGELIENLRSQLDACQGFRVEAFFGINATGLAVAQFLNDQRKPTGLVFQDGATGAREIIIQNCLFPGLPERAQSRILVVDSELKSGSGMDAAIQALMDAYPRANIFYAALAALMQVADAERSFENLRAWPVLRTNLEQGRIKGFFIASTFTEPGFNRPYKTR